MVAAFWWYKWHCISVSEKFHLNPSGLRFCLFWVCSSDTPHHLLSLSFLFCKMRVTTSTVQAITGLKIALEKHLASAWGLWSSGRPPGLFWHLWSGVAKVWVSAPRHQATEAVRGPPFLLNEWRQILTAGARQRNMCQAPEASFPKSPGSREEIWVKGRAERPIYGSMLPASVSQNTYNPVPSAQVLPLWGQLRTKIEECTKLPFPSGKRDSRFHE